MADDTVTIRFGARIEDLVKGVDGVKEKLAELGEMAKTVGELFAIGFGGRELIEFVKSMTELGEQTERTALTLGIGTDAVGQMSGIARLTGTNMDSLALSLERLSLNIQRSTRDAFNPVAQALQTLGLRAKDLIGIPADQYLAKLADAASKFNPSLNLTNALMAVGGRGVQAMIPYLLQGSAAFRAMNEEIAKTGTVLGKETVEALVESKRGIELLGLSMQGLGVSVFGQFESTVDGVVMALRDLVQWFRRASEEGGALSGVMQLVVDIAKALGFILATAVASIKLLAESASFLGKMLTFSASYKEAEKMNQAITEIGAAYDEVIRKIYGKPLHIEGGEDHKSDAAAQNEALKQQLTMQMEALQTQIKMADLRYRAEVDRLSAGVKMFDLTESQKTAAQLRALDERDAAEQRLLAKELALWPRGSIEYQKVLNEMALAHGKFVNERAKVTQEGQIAELQSWNSELSQVQGAWDSQLKGLLAKTTTWTQAMKSIFADLVMMVVKEFEKIVIIETLSKAMQSLFKGFDLTGIFKAIAANIALTYTAAAAYLMPSLGPIGAPIAAAAVAGTVGVVAGAFVAAPIPGAEEGAWTIPATSPWLLHKGETVLPAKAAETFRNMASGGAGGGTVNINVHTIDAAGVSRFFNQHASAMARTLQGHMMANPSSHG